MSASSGHERGNGASAAEPFISISAERHVLGALLSDASFDQVGPLLAEDFYGADHRLIFGAIAELARERQPIDCETVAGRLESREHLTVAGGKEALEKLRANSVTGFRVSEYSSRVRELASQRRLQELIASAVTREELTRGLERELAKLKAAAEDPAARKLSGINFGQMKPHVADGYVIKGLVAPNSSVGIIGETGSGKTFFATDLAMHLAARRPWRGHSVRGGLILYAALEGPVSAENRFVAARDGLKFPATMPLVLTPGPLNLRDPSDVALLVEFIRAAESDHGERCVAVFVDTLSRAMAGGDENGSDHMGALIAGVDAVRLATGCAVILVHHLGKDASRGARGHSSLKAALDTEIEVAARDNMHVATVTKQRDLPAGAQYAFRLKSTELGRDEDGDPVTSCLVEPVDEAPSNRRQPTGKHQKTLLTALLEWQRAHAETDLISTIELHQVAKAQGLNRQRRQEAIEKLEEYRWLQSAGGGCYRLLPEEAS